MKIPRLLLLVLIPLAVHAGTEKTGTSPHTETLTLVLQTQEKKITEVERAQKLLLSAVILVFAGGASIPREVASQIR